MNESAPAPAQDNTRPINAQPPIPDHTQHIMFRHIVALLRIQEAAKGLIDQLHPQDYSPEEKAIADALIQPEILAGKEAQLLELCREILLFVLPGPDIITETIGLSLMVNPDGLRAAAIVLEIQPGKKVVKIMPRKSAEAFEAAYSAFLNEQFGRLIKL